MIKHTVKKNDTLWKLAQNYLGDGSRYKEIMKANGLKDTVIFPGMVLKIPSGGGSHYEEIGKAFEKAMNDVDELPSVKKLYDLIGE